jgi:hypothetical protein
MDILLGIFLIVFGVAIAFIGLQMFFVMLPLIGLVTGFYVGAQLVSVVVGDGFLGTLTGWIVGIVVGVIFALIAWYWWYAGVLVSSGMIGAVLLTGIGHALGARSSVTIFLLAVIGMTAFIVLTLMLNLPIYWVIVNTALGGASIAISGLLLMFNQITREELADGAAVATINESWFWVIAWAALAGVGISRQLTLVQRVRLPNERWSPAT